MMIKKHSGIYRLEVEQKLRTSMDETWEFFSNPGNLSGITPGHMGFEITSPFEDKMYEGQIITYKIGVLPFIRTNWVTEITHVRDGEYFVDEQRSGPYKIWHHEHFFKEVENGVMMRDRVSFKIPFGPAGEIAYNLFIKNELEKIFRFRFEKLEELFNDNKTKINYGENS